MDKTALFEKLSKHEGALAASYSRMEKLWQCPFAWKAHYVDKVKVPPSVDITPDRRVGELMHGILEHCVRTALNGECSRDRYLSVLKLVAGREDETVCARMKDVSPNAYNILRYVLGCEGRKYVEYKFAYGIDGVIRKGTWSPWKTAAFIGVSDLIMVNGREARIIDYKTEHRTEGRAALVANQTSLYAEAVFDMFGVDVVHTEAAYLLDTHIERIATTTRERLAELRERNADLFSRYLETIESEHTWNAIENKYCQWCEYRDNLCPNRKSND